MLRDKVASWQGEAAFGGSQLRAPRLEAGSMSLGAGSRKTSPRVATVRKKSKQKRVAVAADEVADVVEVVPEVMLRG